MTVNLKALNRDQEYTPLVDHRSSGPADSAEPSQDTVRQKVNECWETHRDFTRVVGCVATTNLVIAVPLLGMGIAQNNPSLELLGGFFGGLAALVTGLGVAGCCCSPCECCAVERITIQTGPGDWRSL